MNKGLQQWCWKYCKKCDRWLIASTINFHKDNSKKSGLKSNCKECCSIQERNKVKNKKEKPSKKIKSRKKQDPEYRKKWYEQNKEKELEKRKQYYEANKEKILKNRKERYKNNKEKCIQKSQEYYEDNKESILLYQKEYRENHKEEINEYQRIYYQENKEKIQLKNKEYAKNNPEKIFNYINNRRETLIAQGSGINKEQWLEMMQYFNWQCAYSGESLNDIYRSIDHIISLNKGGVHEVWNCVPMHKNYNSSKQDSDPLEWYKKQPFYSEEKLNKIIEWQKHIYDKYANSSSDLILITETL